MMMVSRDTAGMGRLVLCIGRGLLKDLALLDQRHRSEQLDNRYQRADDQSGERCRKHDRSEDAHLSSVTGESVGVAHVVGGVMDCADVRKADHADDEQTKGHRQNGLNDNVRSGCNGCKTG
jgi:hypothetical protein